MKTVVIATNNKGKLQEFKSLFPNVNIKGLADLGFTDTIIEDGNTFKENALIKARKIAKAYNSIVIADDSGLEVKALNGEPGIKSARYASEHNDALNNEQLIKNLNGITDRRARFVCALCIYFPNDDYRLVEEYCYGLIVDEAKGSNGFGYDPHFYSLDLHKTLAEASMNEKNKISHRAKALRKLKELLNEDFSLK